MSYNDPTLPPLAFPPPAFPPPQGYPPQVEYIKDASQPPLGYPPPKDAPPPESVCAPSQQEKGGAGEFLKCCLPKALCCCLTGDCDDGS